jgi:hypothetical protein
MAETPAQASGSVGIRVLGAVLVVVGTALFVSAALMVRYVELGEVAAFAAVAAAMVGVGLWLARRAGLFTGWLWSGRPWSELLTPGGPVRAPFEWIRVGIAATLGTILVLLVAVAVLAGAGWLNDASFTAAVAVSDTSLEQGIAGATRILALFLGLSALLLGIFAIASFAIGLIGLGLRSGASSMSLRDWVSLDKRN